jgi:hypothetical protein
MDVLKTAHPKPQVNTAGSGQTLKRDRRAGSGEATGLDILSVLGL